MCKKVKVKIFVALLLLSICLPASALELVFSLTPELGFPFLTKGTQRYDPIGYGGMLDSGISLFSCLDLGTTAGFYAFPKNSSNKFADDQAKNLFLVPIGLKTGLTAYPFSRLMLGTAVSGGFSMAISGSDMHYQPWYRADATIAFRVNPSFSIGLTASWIDYQFNTWWENPMLQGLTAGIALSYRFDTKKTSGSVSATAEFDDYVFPLLHTIYKDNSFGMAYITNDETAEIRNIHVSLRSEGYTASQMECGVIQTLGKHKTAEIELIADFSDAILNFTENGQIPAEVVMEYELLGQKRTAVSQIIIPVYNRNQMRWADPAVIASYVSTNSQEVLEFSKYLVGISRRYLRTGLNRNMQFAMYVLEGMRLANIQLDSDPSTPYDEYHLDPSILDYIQYPYQTMLYKSGDKDDLGILFMSMLQSVGIETSFIATNDDFIVLFNTEIQSSKAGSLFDTDERIIILDDDNVWIPISMKALSEGFINSWYKAIEEINYVFEAEENYYFVGIADAWTLYPPAGFASGENVSLETSEQTISDAVETDLVRYITAEFGPQINAVLAQIKKEGASISLYNQLGMLYVRAGMYSNAIPVYQLSAKMGSIPAMNNLGNIASLQDNLEEAVKWYRKVLELDPENATARSNLNRIESELQEE